jgi:hypothetical protein
MILPFPLKLQALTSEDIPFNGAAKGKPSRFPNARYAWSQFSADSPPQV